jgi:8-oxo-dGTP diphosphatase
MPLDVAAAVIQRPDGDFLLARRPTGKVYAGYWEFPGGKIEAGEPPETALARELREELGIEAQTAYPWLTREYVYPHAAVRLSFFRVTRWRGDPHPRERQEIAWQRLGAPLAEPMLPANAPVLAALALPDEYAVTDAVRYGEERMLAAIRRRLGDGLRMLLVRDRDLPQRSKFIEAVLEIAQSAGARVLVSGGHPGADGVHYTAAQLRSLEDRPATGLAAASCHDAGELGKAMALGLDFALLGPVKTTPTHPGARTLAWDGFARLARGATIPVYAIGGVTRADLPEAWRAGGHGVAMIGGAWAGVLDPV